MKRLVLFVAALLLVAAGCGDGGGADEAGSDAPWRTSTEPVGVDGLVWASGSTVHLPDGANIDTGGPIAAYTVAGDGVYFVVDEDPDDATSYAGAMEAELSFADRDGTVTDTGVEILVHTLSASPDGRFLAALDMGEVDDGGRAEIVVWDLATGTETVRAHDGMGDPEDDLPWLYSEVNLDIPLLTDDEVYVETVDDVWSYDLASGAGESLPEDAELPAYDPDSRVSPDGEWQISGNPDEPIGEDESNQDLESRNGQSWRPSLPTSQWLLLGWVDDDTVWGVARGDVPMLMSCEVATRECAVLDATAGQHVQFPVEQLSRGSLTLDLEEL